MHLHRGLVTYLVVVGVLVALLTYRLLAINRPAEGVLIPIGVLLVLLFFPFAAAARYIRKREQRRLPPGRSRAKLLLQSAGILAAGCVLALVIFGVLYPNPWALPAALVVLLAANCAAVLSI